MSGGAAEWTYEQEYPVITGDSSRGPMFEPKEMGGELMLQLFSKSGNAHYEPYWCELNGHVSRSAVQEGVLVCVSPVVVADERMRRPSTCT